MMMFFTRVKKSLGSPPRCGAAEADVAKTAIKENANA